MMQEALTVRDVVEVLEGFAPLDVQEDWDNSGLLIGSMEQEVHGILLGFDCTPELVEEAINCHADMIVTHHPLIFRGVSKICPEDPVGLAIILAIENHIAVYAAHTTADKVKEGVSWVMARKLGLEDIRILDGEQTGLGAAGFWTEPLDWRSAVRKVKEAFGLKYIRASKPVDFVDTVAVCGGSGSSLIEQAREFGAQLYISADISYHHFFTPDGFAIMDVGHFESEKDIVEVFNSLLRKNFPNFAVRVSARLNDSNPVKYI